MEKTTALFFAVALFLLKGAKKPIVHDNRFFTTFRMTREKKPFVILRSEATKNLKRTKAIVLSKKTKNLIKKVKLFFK